MWQKYLGGALVAAMAMAASAESSGLIPPHYAAWAGVAATGVALFLKVTGLDAPQVKP